jgi:hypothetical protein
LYFLSEKTCMVPTSTLLRLPNGLWELVIQGDFSHPHWMAFLFSGLSKYGASVVSGRGAQKDRQWEARITLDFRSSTTNPELLDYVGLAQLKPSISDPVAPRLNSYQITRRLDQSLEVALQGPDQLGFLGRVLSRLSLLMLFPIEVEINTLAGTIRDRIILRGIGGAAPSEAAQKSLDILLKAFITPPSS